MSATLTSLPLETLSLICEYIAVSHKPSIYAFSESTRPCHAASNRARFREVRIRVRTRRGLDHDIREWNKILARNFAFGCVQHLTLEGRLALFWEDGETATSLPAKLLDNLLTEYRREDELTRPGTFYDHIIRGPFYHIGVQEDQDENAWAPMAKLLAKLTGLRDFVYACERRFPERLYEILQLRTPQCKLHIKAFDPPCLDREETEREDEEGREDNEDEDDDAIDKYEYALVTSPGLSTVVVPVAHDDIYRCYNEEAARLMAKGLAPNLKQLHVVDSGPGFKYRPMNRDASKQGLVPRKQVSQDLHKKNLALGQLEGLSLDPANLTRYDLWKETVDFTHLCGLQLWRVQMDTLEAAATCDFSSLKTLALGLFPRRRNPSQAHLSDQAAGAFIASLPPLESIHVTGPFFNESFEAVLNHHGGSLRKLSLYPTETSRIPPIDQFFITSTEIREIQKHCPNVHDLRLQVERTLGDQEEQDIYRALGQVPRLRHLSLQLDVWNAVELGDTDKIALGQSCYSQHIFINVALDAELAREIFNMIASNSPIESLELMPGTEYVWGDLVDILEIMRRHWRCSKVLTAPEDSKVIVEELGEKSRKRRLELNDHVELGMHASAFRQLWPSKTGDLRGWKDGWHSFPLRRTPTRSFSNLETRSSEGAT
ncbi:hypothetical protein BDV10DRAFT_182439 [Aspergillus recurvatus]